MRSFDQKRAFRRRGGWSGQSRCKRPHRPSAGDTSAREGEEGEVNGTTGGTVEMENVQKSSEAVQNSMDVSENHHRNCYA